MTPRREVAFAACLALLLAVGTLGVLLLNTAMQRQAHRLSLQQQRIAALSLQAQQLRATLDRVADPFVLADRARSLRMRPVRTVRLLPGSVSEPSRGAGRDRAG